MRAFIFLCAAALLFSTGCSNYKLGTGGQLSFRTLYVAPVVNEAKVPQAVAVVSTLLRESFLNDPRIILVNTPEEADATLTVRLVKYGRSEKTGRPGDSGLARNFDISLDSEISLRDNRTNTFLFEKRKATATREIFTDGGQQLQAEFQNVPVLAETLAKNIRAAALDVW